jgi:intracellular septation protein A
MKTQIDRVITLASKKIFLVTAVIITLCIATDSALHASHVMVFFSLIAISGLFFALYTESEMHKLGVSLTCIVLGSLYLVFHPIDFTWWRLTFYSVALYFAAILFFISWMITKRSQHT